MNPHPLVTAIIAVHNGEKFIREALDSALNQTYSPLEVIVVDDGSSDGTAELVQEYRDVRYIFQENSGNASARNNGVRLAKGDFVAFLDHDDVWHPQKLEKHMEAFRQDPELLYTVSLFKSFLSPGDAMPDWVRKESFHQAMPDHSPSSLVARKRVFEENGYFNEGLYVTSDMDWFFQAKDRGIRGQVVNECLHWRRVHGGNQSGSVKRVHTEMLGLIRRSVQRKRAVSK